MIMKTFHLSSGDLSNAAGWTGEWRDLDRLPRSVGTEVENGRHGILGNNFRDNRDGRREAFASA
jgi:hypothetical protein